MRLGRWELRWNWEGWRLDRALGLANAGHGFSTTLVDGWSLWWFGPWELWRYDG